MNLDVNEIVRSIKNGNLFCESETPNGPKFVTSKEAKEAGLLGPLFHGTPSPDSKQKILSSGFSFDESTRVNGFSDYRFPLHPLGYGVYATPAKSRAKVYASGATRNIVCLYLKFDPSRIKKISFSSIKNISKFWEKYGWVPPGVHDTGKGRAEKTLEMTRNLAKESLVWFLKRPAFADDFAEHDQYCIFDTSLIYILDEKRDKLERSLEPREAFRIGDFATLKDAGVGKVPLFKVTSIQKNWEPPETYRQKVRSDFAEGRVEGYLAELNEIERFLYLMHWKEVAAGKSGDTVHILPIGGLRQIPAFQDALRRVMPAEAKKIQNSST